MLRRSENRSNNNLSSNERYQFKMNSLDERLAMKEQVKSILNAEQYEKWEEGFGKRNKNNKKRNSQRQRCMM